MKRLLGILITLLLVLPILSGEARADTSGKAGDNITFYCDYETVNRLTINLYDSVKDLETGKIKAKQEFLNN